MSDLCFFEIIDGVHQLRTPVTERMVQLPQRTTWLKDGTTKETELVQNAVRAVLAIVKDCLKFDPQERPDANSLNKRLEKICVEFESSTTLKI